MNPVDFRNSKWRTVNRKFYCIRGMAVDISEITTANPTFSTMTDSTHCWHLR